MVAHCKRVGKGSEALQYLSRYLYRGVISNANILEDDGTHVTCRYLDADTQRWEIRTVTGPAFIGLILQHCLPKGFRRARDYGFLHGNAKATLSIPQWVFRVQRPEPLPKRRVSLPCVHCGAAMRVIGTYATLKIDRDDNEHHAGSGRHNRINPLYRRARHAM